MVLSKCVFDFNFNGTDSISENDAVNSLLKSKFQFHHLSVAQNQQCLKLGISRRQVSDFLWSETCFELDRSSGICKRQTRRPLWTTVADSPFTRLKKSAMGCRLIGNEFSTSHKSHGFEHTPALTQPVRHSIYLPRKDGRLSWPRWTLGLHTEMVYPHMSARPEGELAICCMITSPMP